VFAASQKLTALLVAGFPCLKRKVSVNTPELEGFVATMAGLDGAKAATWRAWARMAWAIAKITEKVYVNIQPRLQ
jgi:hypothetical protein